jgi:hypothetical protein
MSGVTRRFGLGLLAWAIVTLAGCRSGYYPVRGKVTLQDGTPLGKGMVVFENAEGTQMARGMIRSDGSYELSTARPGDGVRPGRYRVLISALDMTDIPDEQKALPFDVKYTRYRTSGLEFEVKAGPNDIPIKLNRPPRKSR